LTVGERVEWSNAAVVSRRTFPARIRGPLLFTSSVYEFPKTLPSVDVEKKKNEKKTTAFADNTEKLPGKSVGSSLVRARWFSERFFATFTATVSPFVVYSVFLTTDLWSRFESIIT